MKTADIILQQLGGNRFVAMTGANHFISDGDALRMSLTKNASRANRLEIRLDWDDTYTMRFYRFTPYRVRVLSDRIVETQEKTEEVKTFSGVYCDRLEELFTMVTGQRTRLF